MSETPAITGTISSGTLRPADLIPAFLDVLKELDENEYNRAFNENADLIAAVADLDASEIDEDDPRIKEIEATYNDDFDSQVAWFLHECLAPAIDSALPEGWEFGSHPGDGALIGIWQWDEDE